MAHARFTPTGQNPRFALVGRETWQNAKFCNLYGTRMQQAVDCAHPVARRNRAARAYYVRKISPHNLVSGARVQPGDLGKQAAT